MNSVFVMNDEGTGVNGVECAALPGSAGSIAI